MFYMEPVRIAENIFWVGGIDWNLRDFHGYTTERGSSYNAYLILDEKITLVDSTKSYLVDEMLERIRKIIDPSTIDYFVCNHVEMDHSGGLPALKKLAPKATVITSPNGEKGLRAHYKPDWEFKIVKTGDSVSLGKRSLKFVLTPMVHWPDNMVAYMPEEKILFSNDAFGQHLASHERFDDEFPPDIVIEEARKYYANIVLPYCNQVKKALDDLKGVAISMIAPSHGLIWRSRPDAILREYAKWAANETENRALIIYDTMWGSTGKMARAIARAFEQKGFRWQLMDLKENHISDIMAEVQTARYICVGSSTLNSEMLPTVAAFLTYMKGLSPKSRTGLAFGSFGWGGQSVANVETMLRACGFDMLENISVKYLPDESQLAEITDKVLAQLI